MKNIGSLWDLKLGKDYQRNFQRKKTEDQNSLESIERND